uniref:Uncharacterized protein n=1 Tax=Lepeophtheirus salmonis TaxID=72036 RepID=A0A0K2U0I4_LEPSM
MPFLLNTSKLVYFT